MQTGTKKEKITDELNFRL